MKHLISSKIKLSPACVGCYFRSRGNLFAYCIEVMTWFCYFQQWAGNLKICIKFMQQLKKDFFFLFFGDRWSHFIMLFGRMRILVNSCWHRVLTPCHSTVSDSAENNNHVLAQLPKLYTHTHQEKFKLDNKFTYLPFKSLQKIRPIYFENGQFENQNFGVLVTSECARAIREKPSKEENIETCFSFGSDWLSFGLMYGVLSVSKMKRRQTSFFLFGVVVVVVVYHIRNAMVSSVHC